MRAENSLSDQPSVENPFIIVTFQSLTSSGLLGGFQITYVCVSQSPPNEVPSVFGNQDFLSLKLKTTLGAKRVCYEILDVREV